MELNWDKVNGLMPAIVQDADSLRVLMLGYMNAEALELTEQSGVVTFFSRTKQKLWTKGETSGNKLSVIKILHDCDNDTLLITALNNGPTCHLGRESCFQESPGNINFIAKLEAVIDSSFEEKNSNSYTYSLFIDGIKEMAKKVTEEAGEVAISAVTDDGRVKEESADLVYHLLVMLRKMDVSFDEVLDVLEQRSAK
ncbi:bifunctional phosphoribosyl-AMP cyclohydrolase/phosphoribosyl-ATP diphosphatase HisIE [Gammaproteobacteria bacterium]|nr:bifunctional phosphoribosyl-AMP cyclohydrolase/phosphoribosyl-ATP diphosphatase HisIE [Gammaproteobacteria bacterium]